MHLVVRPLNEREIPDGVEDPILAKAYLEMAYGLEADFAPFGWDQPPVLLFLRVRERVDLNGAVALVVDGTPVPRFHLLVSNYMSQGGRMHHALLSVADAFQAMRSSPPFQKLDLREVQGVALVHEGWALMGPGFEDVAERREIHRHPERVETRMVHVSGPDGLRVNINFPRDGVPMQMMGQARPGTEPSTYSVGGDVPNALQYLLETVQGKAPGDWRVWEQQYTYTR